MSLLLTDVEYLDECSLMFFDDFNGLHILLIKMNGATALLKLQWFAMLPDGLGLTLLKRDVYTFTGLGTSVRGYT